MKLKKAAINNSAANQQYSERRKNLHAHIRPLSWGLIRSDDNEAATGRLGLLQYRWILM